MTNREQIQASYEQARDNMLPLIREVMGTLKFGVQFVKHSSGQGVRVNIAPVPDDTPTILWHRDGNRIAPL